MFVYIQKYLFTHPSEVDGVIPVEILPIPKELIAVSSTDARDSKSKEYLYEPIIKKVLDSPYMSYPLTLIFETYSKELVEEALKENKLSFSLLLEKHHIVETDVFKVVIEKEDDLWSVFPIWSTSGTDSLFNILTESDEIVCVTEGHIYIDLNKNPSSKSLFFMYDLQELCFLGYEKPQDRAYIKKHFLQGAEIVDDYVIEL